MDVPPPIPPIGPNDLEVEVDRDQEIISVVMQDDWLRILLQGHAKIEHLLDEIVSEEFHGEMPRELGSLPFPRRVAVARGLRLIQQETKTKVLHVADVRHNIAHGTDAIELTAAQINQLRQVVGDKLDVSGWQPTDLLRAALALTWGALVGDAAVAHYRRRFAKRAVAAFRTNQFASGRVAESLIAALLADQPGKPASN